MQVSTAMVKPMKTQLIQTLTADFESFARRTDAGVEFWLARDLQQLLGYGEWRNFEKVIERAKVACEVSGKIASDHFVDANKTLQMPKGASKTVADYMLTRYACYLIAQNGDPRKEKIAFAQTYFAVQTRKYEVIEERLLAAERITARKKLADAERELSGVIFEATGSEKNFGIIRSKGDKALFGYSTDQMKKKWSVPKGRALADFAPTIILKAKDFATEITIYNTKANKLRSEQAVSHEHTKNNASVRNTLLDRGIRPELLPPDPDVKKIERTLRNTEQQSLIDSSSLKTT